MSKLHVRQHLRDGYRFHIVHSASVEIALLDHPFERRIFPTGPIERDDVDVVQEKQSPSPVPARKPRVEIAAVFLGTDELRGNALALEILLEKFRALPLAAGRVGRIDPDVVAKERDGRLFKPSLGSSGDLRLPFGKRDLRRLPPARRDENREKNEKASEESELITRHRPA